MPQLQAHPFLLPHFNLTDNQCVSYPQYVLSFAEECQKKSTCHV